MDGEFQGRNLMKRKYDVIFVIIPAVIAGLIIFHVIFHIRILSKPLTSETQILDAVVDAALDGKRTLKFKSTVIPSEEIIDNVFPETFEHNKYMGAEVHHYKYTYIPQGIYYKVTVKISKPSFIASVLTKIRVRQIANHLRGLSTDYEKVKAAHDYLICLNKYNYIKGGAFSCLYGRESACNGYAYSFYLIMTELGIPVTCDFGSNHVWNRVKIGEYWYNIDVTFDDSGYPEGYYGYFLKCNADWTEHEYGLSDAPSSLPVTGPSCGDNYRKIPNYRLIAMLSAAVLAVGLFFLLKLIRKKWNAHELKRIQKDLEMQEKARILFEEQLQKKREEFAKEDHNLY